MRSKEHEKAEELLGSENSGVVSDNGQEESDEII